MFHADHQVSGGPVHDWPGWLGRTTFCHEGEGWALRLG
jgi:hypothetical protein